MWRLSACVILLLNGLLGPAAGNGYYGGGGEDESPVQAQPQAASQQSYPEYESPGGSPDTKGQDFWWMKNNPFQRPPNHPGLEKGDQGSPQPQNNHAGPSPRRPNPQPAIPSFGGQQSYSQAPQPKSPRPGQNAPEPSPDCLLQNQADCHIGASLTNAAQGNPNYQQQQTFSGYPSGSEPGSYPVNIPGPPKVGPGGSRAPVPQQQEFQLGQKPGGQGSRSPYQSNPQQRPLAQASQGPEQQSYGPASNSLSSQYAGSGQPAQESNPGNYGPPSPKRVNDYSNKVPYRPPSLPYQETQTPYGNPGSQAQVNSQPSGPGNNNYEDQPPYPGCPAAMLCVPENYCNSKGVSEGKPISLSPAEKLYRVALMACSSPSSGDVGVCCRDPDYKDPWPNMSGNDGQPHQHGGFDDGQYHGHAAKEPQPPAPQSNQPRPSNQQAQQAYPNQQAPQAYPNQQAQQAYPNQQAPQAYPNQQAQPYSNQQAQPPSGYQGLQTSASFDAPVISECHAEEVCLESSKCDQGYISDEWVEGLVDLGFTKCAGDAGGMKFTCCKRKLTKEAVPEPYQPLDSNPGLERPVHSTTPKYQSNYLLKNTLGTTLSTLISGTGFPYVQRSQPNTHLRFSNPYKPHEKPIYIVTRTTRRPATNTPQTDTSRSTSSTASPVSSTTSLGSTTTSPNSTTTSPTDATPTEAPLNNVTLSNHEDSAETTIPFDTDHEHELTSLRRLGMNRSPISGSEPSPAPLSGDETPTTTEMPEEDDQTTMTPDPTAGVTNEPFEYNPNPISFDDLVESRTLAPAQVPALFYQLPALPSEEPDSATEANNGTEEEEPAIGIRAGFPKTRKSFVEECPNTMKCLRESYCQETNPNEGSTDVFDIRLSFRKSSRLKCKQPNLPVDGVCCFLREDYMSQITTAPLSISIEPTPKPLPEAACGVRHMRTGPETETPDTEFGEFPWQVLIIAGSKECSGAIIDRRVIATAASCVHGMKEEEIIVRVGEWDQNSLSESKPHQDLHVSIIIRHPKYVPSNQSYNLALVYTAETINFDYHIGRICLPQPVSNFDGKRCISTGWGSARRKPVRGTDASKERVLLRTDLTIMNSYDCVLRLQNTSLGSDFKLPRTSLCAGGESKRDICNGDEGSPLFCETSSSGEFALAGFLMGTDWGVNCDKPDVPGVFSNLPTLVEWMYNFIRQDPSTVIIGQMRLKNKMST